MTVGTDVLTARPSCQAARAGLGAYIRAGLPTREAHRVSAHLECCRPCTAAYLELVEADGHFRGWPSVLAPRGALIRLTVASAVIGGLLVAGHAMLGGDESGGPDGGPVAAPPFATAPVSATDGRIEKPSRKPHRKPHATHSANTANSTHSKLAPSNDATASLGHSGNGGAVSPPQPGVVTISSEQLTAGLPLPSTPLTLTITVTPGAALHERSIADHRASTVREGRV